VYATAIESAASIGAGSAVRDQGQVAVGLTNTTHFLRPVTTGRVTVEATALSQGRTQQFVAGGYHRRGGPARRSRRGPPAEHRRAVTSRAVS
jgi:acyl-coenzyme A thioesterase PaaI-like protein